MPMISQRQKKHQAGFSMAELMIIVTITGILAAIAIPYYRNYQLKSKTTEVKANLDAIYTAQYVYHAEHDQYKTAGNNPPASACDAVKDPWNTEGNFTDLGFCPAGSVYYTYRIPAANATDFTAFAEADLDANGGNAGANGTTTWGNPANGFFKIDENGNLADRNPGLY